VELRDGDASKYLGKGVLKAVTSINEKISPILVDMDPIKQAEIDKAMIDLDNTENKVQVLSDFCLWLSLVLHISSGKMFLCGFMLCVMVKFIKSTQCEFHFGSKIFKETQVILTETNGFCFQTDNREHF
jgi:hypothetical protein